MYSVVIPYFNDQRFIHRCIASVYAQTFGSDDVIVVNDGSEQSAVAVLEKLQKKFPFRIVSKENGGLSSARNSGFAATKHGLVAFIDSDDEWYPTFAEKLVPIIDMEPCAGIVFSRIEWIDENSELIGFQNSFCPRPNFKILAKRQAIGSGSNWIIRKVALEDIGGFDSHLKSCEDLEFCLQVSLSKWKIIGIDDVLVRYRKRNRSLSQDFRSMDASYAYVTKKLCPKLSQKQLYLLRVGFLRQRMVIRLSPARVLFYSLFSRIRRNLALRTN